MRFTLAFVLICLLIIATPCAAAGSIIGKTPTITKVPATFSMKELADVSCSDDTYAPLPESAVLWIVFLSEKPEITIDGKFQMMWGNDELGGKWGYQYSTPPGMHTVVFSSPGGYSNYTVKVQTCSKKISYVFYDLNAHAITTTPTTTATVKTTTVPATTVSLSQSTPQATQQVTQQTTTRASTTAAPLDTLGTLSIVTTPSGASIFIDGIQQGASPATIPGLSAGTHTLLLTRDGYQDLSMPVTVVTGKTQKYTTALVREGEVVTRTTGTANATATPKKTPGFEFALAFTAMGAILALRKVS